MDLGPEHNKEARHKLLQEKTPIFVVWHMIVSSVPASFNNTHSHHRHGHDAYLSSRLTQRPRHCHAATSPRLSQQPSRSRSASLSVHQWPRGWVLLISLPVCCFQVSLRTEHCCGILFKCHTHAFSYRVPRIEWDFVSGKIMVNAIV